MIGLFDYEWTTEQTIWEYLKRIRNDNVRLWDKIVGVTLPPDGTSFYDNVAIIPRENSEVLIEKLSIDDNIILTIPKRISYRRIGVINKRLKSNIVTEFYRLAEVTNPHCSIRKLSRVQRKILSAYRWEIAKPETMLFENPYWGMDVEETKQFQKYLVHLKEKGIQIICFSKSLEELQTESKIILISHNGREVEILSDKLKNYTK
jgi:ABC-type sugar transport system ATPase subunit